MPSTHPPDRDPAAVLSPPEPSPRSSPGSLSRMTTAEQVAATLGRPAPIVMMKQIDRLDDGCTAVIERAPVAGFGYRGADGERGATFVGGAPGFVRVDSATRISVPFPADEHPGRPVVGSGVSFVFLLPGVGETLRLNGSLAAHDAGVLAVDVQEAYVHCARALLRSRLWQRRPAVTTPPVAAAADPIPAPPDTDVAPLHRPDVARFLQSAPFLVLSTGDASGAGDISPRGDRPGFARALDGHTLVIPDRKGNQRADSFYNVVQDGRVALAALVPGRTEVLHLHGTAHITDDAALLETMSLRGTPPQAALVVEVRGAALSTGAAVERARLWDPTAHLGRGAVPDLIVLASRHAAANPTKVAGGPPAFLTKPLAAFPRFTRWLIDLGYRKVIEAEGFGEAPVRPGRFHLLPHRWRPGRATDAAAPGTGPGGGARRMRVTAVRRETPDALTITMEDAAGPARPVHFRPGQFFTLVVEVGGDTGAAGTAGLGRRTVRRAYSASSVPGSSRLEVTVKRVADGVLSNHVHEHLKAGDSLEIRGPSGTFCVDHRRPADEEQLVMIAAGSGVTPVMSIIRTVLAGRTSTRLALLYGNRTEEGTIFAGELDRLRRQHADRLTVTHRLTRPSPEWTGARGRLDAAAIRHWLDELAPSSRARYFVCGPDAVADTARGVLADLGIPESRIHAESYTSAHIDGAPATGPHHLSVEDNGRPIGTAVVEPGETLLSAGLAAGLPMPYSCTVGNCGECLVALRGGRVEVSRPNCLTPQQQAEGYTLTCVGRTASAVTIDIAEE
ncbi:2Fe-2S iron-sulfur cluster-binding protein [Streptomyces sp. CWNU-52B]|uniref:2Fe-2S iron-sulfur cluster-binding protein n=1 Tax=unclassified Streptomyces TaxID=2593676 RepID=UPI0039BFBFDD